MVLGYVFLAVILIFSLRTWIKVIREFRRSGRGSDRGGDV